MGNNPVGKKVNTPKVNARVNTFLLLALGFYQNPNHPLLGTAHI